jgi:hypothetical protein
LNRSGCALWTGCVAGSTSPACTKYSTPLTSHENDVEARTFLSVCHQEVSPYLKAFATSTPGPDRQIPRRPRWPVGRNDAPNKWGSTRR